ncbi:MAG: hypothetical protein M3347_16605, partial [Armatimonadota bacterium]|nr:hypothetical protein [Armatimonadota bacterium]
IGLTELPESIGQLAQLQRLYVHSNELSALPESIGQLVQLQRLYVSNNHLSALPEGLLKLAEAGTLRELYLHDNANLGIPAEILGPSFATVYSSENWQLPEDKRIKAQDPERIARYYRQVLSGPVRPLNEAKVLVVGPGGNGKSSLIEFLLTGRFEPTKKSTEGVQVCHWDIEGGVEDASLRLNIWDFGGQELQYSTHEFFLSERAVYVLVFQHRDDIATPDGLFYWLDLIHLVAPAAPVIVAFSKQDEHPGLPNGLADLKKLHENIVDFVPISCVDTPRTRHFAENARRLRDVVRATACRELAHVHYKLPAAWMSVKEQLEQPDHDYLSFAAFQELCAAKGVTDPDDQKLLADYLHDLGTMLNYSDRVAYEKTHILNPEWVTNGVYALSIWKAELDKTGGILTDSRVSARLGEPQYQGKYPPEAQRFIVEMMLSYKLCYELPRAGKERRYLVPNALPEDPPPLSFDDAGALRFEIRFPRIMPTSIISRFIVEMHKRGSFTVWRLGVQGAMSGHAFRVTAHPKEKAIRIAIAGTGPARIRLLEIIRAEFAAICREREYNQEEYTFPPNHPNAQPYLFESLMKAERAEKDEIWLPDAGDVKVQEWLNGITNPTERKKLQEAILEAAKRGVINIGHLGDNVSENTTNINAAGMSNAGAFTVTSGDNNAVEVTASDNQAQIQHLVDNPAELKAEIEKLRVLIEQARAAGADEDDCDFAVKKVAQLEAAAEKPDDEANKEKASGALKRLKDIAEGFKNYAEIGENFETILKLVAPALGALLGTPLSF